MILPRPGLLAAPLFMCLLFAYTYFATRFALSGLGIFQILFIRYAIALTALVVLFHRRLALFRLNRPDRQAMALMTLVEPVFYFTCETLGLKFTSPINVSLMIATIPIFAAVFAYFLLGERVDWPGRLGILISFIGVFTIIQFQNQNVYAPRPVLGNLFALGAATAAGLYNSLGKRLVSKYPPITLTFYQALAATLWFFPLALLQWLSGTAPRINLLIVGHLLYLGLGSSILAYLILNSTLARLGASQVALFSNLIPVFTALLSYLLWGEVFKAHQLLGACLVLVGVSLTVGRASVKTAGSYPHQV